MYIGQYVVELAYFSHKFVEKKAHEFNSYQFFGSLNQSLSVLIKHYNFQLKFYFLYDPERTAFTSGICSFLHLGWFFTLHYVIDFTLCDRFNLISCSGRVRCMG